MRRARRALVPVACLVAGLVLLAGCSGVPAAEGPVEEPATATIPEQAGGLDDVVPQRYVALGDSFTAGPLVPTTDLADGCLRSDGNYPSLLATSLDLDLTDVSCSAASASARCRAANSSGVGMRTICPALFRSPSIAPCGSAAMARRAKPRSQLACAYTRRG